MRTDAMSWTLIADGLLAVLLVATLFYVRRFSRQVAVIRDSRGEFEKLIADLTRSTDQAASHLHQFNATAELAGSDLQARVERAQGLTAEFGKMGDDLKLLAERAEAAANRLEAVIARGRHIAAVSAPSPAAAPPAPGVAFADDEDDRKMASLGALSGLR
jgi:methyl-accepting chemotaxis protein